MHNVIDDDKPSAINFVAKHDFNRAAVHEDKKRRSRLSKRKQKHKKVVYADSF